MKTAVVICPGRGTYTKSELGYLSRHHAKKTALLRRFDAERARLGQETLAELDGANAFSVARHTRGDNAAALIYAVTLADLQSIDLQSMEIVAVTGNSMGWYSALACAGSLSADHGFRLANTMGTLLHEAMIGGQTLYPFVDEDWRPAPDRKSELLSEVDHIAGRADHELSLSIDLGGMLVLAGNEAGLSAFEQSVPPLQNRFPMRLANHAAFHSPLQAPIAAAGHSRFRGDLLGQPALPLIDGRGVIWWPDATDTEALLDYTLGHQVTKPYDFTHAIAIAAHEFAPDIFIVTGPGTTLGGTVAQSLILCGWRGMGSKADFQSVQERAPLLVSMGMDDQRATVT